MGEHAAAYLRGSSSITDAELVRAIVALRVKNLSGGYYWVMIWDLAEWFDIHPNRIRSKVRRAHRRGLVDGCICGCRGDFELLPAGELLATEIGESC